MKNYKLLPLLLVLPTLAKGNVTPPCSPCCEPSSWSFYGGAGAGVSFLRGNWNLTNLTIGTDRTSNKYLETSSGRIEAYFGGAWRIPTTDVSLGLEPYFSYSNAKQNDFNPLLVGVIPVVPPINVFDSIAQTAKSTLSTGVDFRPSYQFNESPHSVYALVGFSVTQFQYRFYNQAPNSSFEKNMYPWGVNWGLGYEYRMSESAIGVRFREELFRQKKLSFSNTGGNFLASIKPNIYSVMLTYSYYFQ